MSITNREVFAHDPTVGDIPNLGVAKVKNPDNAGDWATLEWELRSFVCEGEYERGLNRILDQFLSHLNQTEQPAAWVSGFYGSGKSHLMRVLEYLWRDYQLPSGASARALASLPSEIQAHLTELSAAGKRAGGLWSAAGTLGSGASGSVRLAFLGVIFEAAGFPRLYGPARFVMWLKNEGLYDEVHTRVTKSGKSFGDVLRSLYVSPILAQALIEAGASFGNTHEAVSTALQNQFAMVDDIDLNSAVKDFGEVMRLQSNTPDKLPMTLVVLDEMQQYINDDNKVAEQVQLLVEACSSSFDCQVLVVATGQSALTANPTLQKLMGRFSVTVALSDTDVETVVRKVVLRKKPDSVDAIEESLNVVSGEIDRELGGTRLAATAADKVTLVSDYPMLPTRRRFWERALRAIDKAGKAGVLRTQLKIVHEAVRSVADKPLGHVIGGDFLFRSESASMLQSGVLLKEIDELIRSLGDGTADGELKSRACSLIFLISQLPHEGVGDTGVRATPAMIADLLVEDLSADGAQLRKDVPRVLGELAEQGRLMKLGDEFRLQTEEGAEWTKEFNQRRASVSTDAARMAQLRNEWLVKTVEADLAGLKLTHGESKISRKIECHWGDDEPTADGTAVHVWIRDEWNVIESKVKESAAQAGNESPTVFVLLPKVDADGIRDALASLAAAKDAINQRPEPQTDEGRQAKQGMQFRVLEGEQRLTNLFGMVVAKARIFQGGGNELTSASFRDSIETGCKHALSRQFSKFGPADNANWIKVSNRARDGAADALSLVGWNADVPANPVCKEVLARTSAGGTKGSEILRQLGDPPYGWPKDAVDGALLALLANGNVRAERDTKAVAGAKELPTTQIGKATFFKEDDPPTTPERMAVRGVLTDAKVPYTTGQEAAAISGLLQHLVDLAERAGGSAPLPEPPDTAHIQGLLALAGNQQFRAVAEASDQLRQDVGVWSAASAQRSQRETAWLRLDRLLAHAKYLPQVEDVQEQRNAVLSSRLLLSDPDPVQPLIGQVCDALRSELAGLAEVVVAAQADEIQKLEFSAEWQQIEPDERSALIEQVGLVAVRVPSVRSDDELLQALDANPLEAWKERQQALPAKGAAARTAAAKKLEPKSVTVKPESATIKTEADVDVYLSSLRENLMGHVNAGETVII